MRSITRIALLLAGTSFLGAVAGAKQTLDDAGKCRASNTEPVPSSSAAKPK